MRHTSAPENLLLRAASGGKRSNFHGKLKHLAFEAGHRFWPPEEPIPYALFPLRGVVSLQLAAAPGKQVEIGVVGREGFLELALLLGAEKTQMNAVALTSGAAVAMDPDVFRDSLNRTVFKTA